MKRRNIIYIVVCVLFCFVCLACSDETENAFAPTETGLILQINVGQNTFTRADGTTNSSAESAWDNVIHYLDVFIFDSTTGKLVPNCYFHFGDGTNNIVDPVCLISGNWKTYFQDYETCDVYVVANLHIHSSGDNAASETLKDIENLSELQQLTDEYQNIYQPVSPGSKKPFTMSGYRMGWEPAASSNVYTIPVELTRLAAKIEISLDLRLTGEITVNGTTYQYPTNEDIGQLQYSVHNYATNALVLPGNDGTFGYTIASAAEANLKFVDKDDSDKSVPKIIAYTYPTEWTNDILKETYVILNAQLRSITMSNEGTYQYMDNYYKIPLRLSTDENKKLERNHWYKVNAIISALGNATPDEPVELTDVHYEVAPWNDMNIDINGDIPMYLELSEYDVVMRNVDTYDLTFASSSQIAKPENENEKADINIKEIYYYNKNGKKINITDPEILNKTYLSVEGSLNGNLVIHSPIPENKTIRYITLTVKNTQYKEDDSGTNSCIKTVTIKQYPLEYITGIAGLYSYLENDNRYTNVWPTNLTTIGNIKIDQRIGVGLNKHIGKSVDMKSKFYLENGENSRIYRIDYSYDSEDNYLVDNGTASNNQMYHVVITSTSDQYKLARPPMTSDAEDATVVQNSINNDFVSPSFMLASQLGNSSVISWDEAQTQCQHYVEVGNNDIKYNDWRLPTLEEIKIIKQYQEAVPDVMDAVLETREKNEDNKDANPYYWTAIEDVYHYTGNQTDTTNGGRTECRVRCVRDFHVGEPTE